MRSINHVEMDSDRLLNGFDVDLGILRRYQVAQGLVREFQSYSAVIGGGKRHQPVQAAFELAYIGKNVLGDVLSNLQWQDKVVIRGFFLQDGDPSFEVGRRNVGGKSAFETIAQALLESRDVTRNHVRGQNDLTVSGMQRIEGVKQFLLSPLAAGQKLYVVEKERIRTAKLRLELPILLALSEAISSLVKFSADMKMTLRRPFPSLSNRWPMALAK